MRAPFLTLGLSALLTIGVVLGFVGLRTQRTLDAEDAVPTPVVITDVSIPAPPAQVTGPTETVLLRIYALAARAGGIGGAKHVPDARTPRRPRRPTTHSI